MAPRSRSRVGTTRRDAALDAMKLMGFPENAVRRTLNRLLNVYGPDGWAFIEADAYRVLVDELLEPNDVDQPNNQNQDDVMVRENQPDEGWAEENFGYPDRPQPSEFVNGQEVQAPVKYVQSYTVVELNPVLQPTEFGGNDIPVQEMTQQQQAAEVECAVEREEVQAPVEYVQRYTVVELNPVPEPTEVGGNDFHVQEMTQQEQAQEAARALENHVEREEMTQQMQVEPAMEYTVEHEVSGPVMQRRTIGHSGLRPSVPPLRRRRTPRIRVPRSSVPAFTQTHTTHASRLQVSIPAPTPKHTTHASDAQLSVPEIRPSHTNAPVIVGQLLTIKGTSHASDGSAAMMKTSSWGVHENKLVHLFKIC